MSKTNRAHFPFPWRIAWRVLLNDRPVPGAWRADALAYFERQRPRLGVTGAEQLPAAGGLLLTANHYARRGVPAWWMPLAVSAATPVDVHWITTAALWYPGGPRAWVVTPITRWFLARAARVYGFTTMPPMPPKPNEVEARAGAVRAVLRWVRQAPRPVVGLAPEGGDGGPTAQLHAPPPGLGRFIHRLERVGLAIVPVGVFDMDGALRVKMGAPYRLAELGLGRESRRSDAAIAGVVMRQIAALLPPELRGRYDSPMPREA